jgi:hypothetical protein
MAPDWQPDFEQLVDENLGRYEHHHRESGHEGDVPD